MPIPVARVPARFPLPVRLSESGGASRLAAPSPPAYLAPLIHVSEPPGVYGPASRPLVARYPSPVSHLHPRALTEADLSLLWEGQRFPPEALNTRDGRRLRVVYRGRPSRGPGPDFRDAVIAAPDGLLQGDVELHVRSADWRRHGHSEDPAYAGVALHVVFWDDGGEPFTALPGGGAAPVVALADWAEGRAREIRAWLEQPASWQEPCRSAVQRLGADGTGVVLDRLGGMRFRQKAAAFGRRLETEDGEQLLWEGLLEALGYGGDREAFRSLAHAVPWAEVRGALLTLPAEERRAPARQLLSAAAGNALSGRPAHGALRPGNGPERRLEGAAALAARFAQPGFAFVLAPLIEQAAADGVRALTAALTVSTLVGPARAQEMLANAVLPCLAATGDERLSRLAEAAYGRLPLPARYGAVRHLHRALGGLPLSARRQQGMLYLLRQYCSQGGCGKCPLS